MVSFNFTFADGTPIEVMSAFWEAADAWSVERVDSDILDVVTDDATLNIYVDYGALPDAALAGSRPGMTRVQYTDFLNKFNSDSSSPDDQSAVSYLEPGSSFEYLREAYNSDTNTWGETSEVDSANTIWLTRSNAKALNLIDGNDGDFDASIRVSNSAPWHFDSNSGVPGDKYDLLTVAKHEISHVLGFISGTDVFDLLAEEGSITDQDLDYVSPMDLLRYSEASSQLGVPDWTRGQTYFSLDGGDNNLGDFATGISNDGFQASHWQDGDSRGVTSPLLQQGQRIEISDLDLRLLDGVGWDRISQLQADVKETTQTIDWTSPDPDLTPLENLLTGYLDEGLARLASERDAIKELDPELWSELEGKAEEESQKQREAIQITLGKVEENKDNPDKRTEEAIKGASDEQKALADLDKFYFDKLEEPLKGQINDWLDGSPTELKENIENATDLQLFTLAITVSSADEAQRTEWNNDLREALGLLYQETFNGQSPTGTQLDAALAKLLSISSLDEVARRGSGGSRIRWWQTGESVDAELAELESNAAPEQAIYSESSWQSDLASESADLDSSSVDITGATTIDNSVFSIPELPGESETVGATELNGNFNIYGQGGEFENWKASTGILEPVWEVDNVESVEDI
ncbi:MAG: NF038122 family metalloprotease [Waterburya sp.]